MNSTKLRELIKNIRTKPTPLSDFIPVIQEAADKLDKYELRHEKQRKRIDELEKDLHMLQRHYDQLGDIK